MSPLIVVSKAPTLVPALRWILAVIVAAACVSWPRPAQAHPHVWIKMRVAATVAGERLVKLDMEYRFDEVFSSDVISTFERTRTGRFDAVETAALKKGAFDYLFTSNYFVRIQRGTKTLAPIRADTFRPSIVGHVLVYRFTLPAPSGATLDGPGLKIDFFDPSYYIDVEFDEREPIRMTGAKPACRARADWDHEFAYYNGRINPVAAFLTCP